VYLLGIAKEVDLIVHIAPSGSGISRFVTERTTEHSSAYRCSVALYVCVYAILII
jgi:hypothetical protein